MIFALLIGFFTITEIALFCSKNDLVSPGVLVSFMFTISIAYSFYNFERWQLMQYGFNTIILILVGTGIFVFISIMFNISNTKDIQNINLQRINLSLLKIILVITMSIMSIVTYLIYMKRITDHFGYYSLKISQSIQTVRSMRQAGDLVSELELPIMVNFLIKSTSIFSTLFIFIYNYNKIIGKHIKFDYLLILPFLFHVIVSLLQSNRGNILQSLISIILMRYMLSRNFYKNTLNVNKIFLKRIFWITIIIVPLFFGATYIMGRYDSKSFSSVDGFYYVGVYLSGGIRNFDLYLKQGGLKLKFFGEETFVSLNNFIISHFTNYEQYVRHLEFRFANGWGAGNIYTSFRRFYHDFGVLGVLILPFIQSIVSSIVYKKAKQTSNSIISFSKVLYAYFAYTIVYIPIDDLFFSSVVSVSGLEKIILIYLEYIFVFKFRLGFKIKKQEESY